MTRSKQGGQGDLVRKLCKHANHTVAAAAHRSSRPALMQSIIMRWALKMNALIIGVVPFSSISEASACVLAAKSICMTSHSYHGDIMSYVETGDGRRVTCTGQVVPTCHHSARHCHQITGGENATLQSLIEEGEQNVRRRFKKGKKGSTADIPCSSACAQCRERRRQETERAEQVVRGRIDCTSARSAAEGGRGGRAKEVKSEGKEEVMRADRPTEDRRFCSACGPRTEEEPT